MKKSPSKVPERVHGPGFRFPPRLYPKGNPEADTTTTVEFDTEPIGKRPSVIMMDDPEAEEMLSTLEFRARLRALVKFWGKREKGSVDRSTRPFVVRYTWWRRLLFPLTPRIAALTWLAVFFTAWRLL